MPREPIVPVINAAGFVTALGGAPLCDAAASAYAEAIRQSWDVAVLSEQVGAELAAITGAPAACVTGGAAAGLALAVAACAAGGSPATADALPAAGQFTVVVQACLHNSYDRMARLCGARIVTAGYPTRPGLGQTISWQLDSAIDDRTTAVLHTIAADAGAISLRQVAAIAHARGVPVVVDAAAELPPAANLSRYLSDGADVVVFSGGKALRGPQESGLLLGRADLIKSARLQQLDMDVDPSLWRERTGEDPWQHGIGRAMKVGPATMIALLAAVREFVGIPHEEIAREQQRWLAGLQQELGAGELVPGDSAGGTGFYPSLVFDLGPELARRAWLALAGRQPSVRLAQSELASGRLRLRPEALNPAGREAIRFGLADMRALLAS